MTSSAGEARASAMHDQSPFLDPLPWGWDDLGTHECTCPVCEKTYYRRVSISPNRIVHSERTHCDCTWARAEREQMVEKQIQQRQEEAARERVRKQVNQYFSKYDLLRDAECKDMFLDNYDPNHKTQESALAYLKGLDGNGHRNVCLQGLPGRGKTHLAIGLLRNMRKQGKTVLGIKCIDMLNRLREGYGEKKDTDKLSELLKQIDVLLMDDIGVGNTKDWAEGKLYEIIDARRSSKITVFTTNYTEEELEKKIFARLTSRIMDQQIGKVFYIKGYDRRRAGDMWLEVGKEVDYTEVPR